MELLSFLTALIMNIANLAFSLYYINRIMAKDWKTFVTRFYTMMMIRFAVVLTLFFILLIWVKMDELYLSLTFILSYFIVLIVEILYLNKRYSNLIFKQPKK